MKYHTCRQAEVLCHVLSVVLNSATYSFDLHDPVFFLCFFLLGEAWYGDGSLRLKELPDLCLTQGAIAH